MLGLLCNFYRYMTQAPAASERGTKQIDRTDLCIDVDFGKECNICGTVTKVNASSCYGVINGVIYFDFDIVSEEVRVGDAVFVRATRKELYHGWTAISVTVSKPEWDTEEGEKSSSVPRNNYVLNTKSVDGIVRAIYSTFGVLDNDCQFSLHDCALDFFPIVGDLIEGSTSFNNAKRLCVWRPKHIKEIEGVITTLETECGVINEDTIFFLPSVQCKIALHNGMNIKALALESNQNAFKWRAFRIIPIETENSISEKPLKKCVKSKEGIEVPRYVNFDCVEQRSEKTVEVDIKNSTKEPINLINCSFQKPKSICPFYLSLEKSDFEPVKIQPGSKHFIKIACHAAMVGFDSDLLLFEFDDFIISQKIEIKVENPMQKFLKSSAPFSRQKPHSTIWPENEVVCIPGEKIFYPRANFTAWKQPKYAVPRNIWQIIEERQNVMEALPVLSEELQKSNYVRKFDCLLFLEEIQMSIHMRQFDLNDVVLQRKGEFLSLEVPGLAEGRPSLLIGDKALLFTPEDPSKVAYEGYIHEVHQNSIYLKFNDRFQNIYNEEIFNASFKFGRSNMKRFHDAVHKVFEAKSFLLFPTVVKFQKPFVQVKDSYSGNAVKSNLNWQNKNLNDKQKLAVERILENISRPLPYIIFGPPGTGKTVTLVEAVLQVYHIFQNARILICAPSNSAADLIASRLVMSDQIGTEDMVRLNSYQRNEESIPEFIKPFCLDKRNLDAVVKYPVIISTCTTSGCFTDLELAADHFTHVFIDEAGQLSEPEALVTISVVRNNRNASLVLAGDPKQLGPILFSKIAKTMGLELSYMQRVMSTPLYDRNENHHLNNGYNPVLVSMLTESYRMHPDILHYSSKKFYYSQMQCSVPEERHKILTNWDLLPQKGFPIIFHGVNGEEEREENSPSWYNSSEIVVIIKYLQELYSYGLKPEDIGIIAPYKKQVEKFRFMFNILNVEFCKIGSVEEFQGQERRVIIISTVRSSQNLVEFDVIHNLGFLTNPKRFNVAITRAKELLIVVGNPTVLAQDYYWDGFIKYCTSKGGYTGYLP